MKRRIVLVALIAILGACVAIVEVPPLLTNPTYSVSQLLVGLTPRHNVWGGHTVSVRAVAVLGSDIGARPNTVILYDHAPSGASAGFLVSVAQPNLTFARLSWVAWIGRHMPGMRWMYGEQPDVYRVRFLRPTWCMSCPIGQLE